MTYSLIYMLTQQPHMLAVHAQAYADLLHQEAARALQQTQKRIWLYVASAGMVFAAVIFTGVAVMLWGTLPWALMGRPEVLIATPLVAWLIAWVLWRMAGSVSIGQGLSEFKQQIDADVAMLRELSA